MSEHSNPEHVTAEPQGRPKEWLGAEAAVGFPPGETPWPRRFLPYGEGMIWLIVALSFTGGLALGGALACLRRRDHD